MMAGRNKKKIDYVSAMIAYATSDASLESIAKRFGCSYQSILNRAKKENWKAQRAKFKQRVTKTAVRGLATKKANVIKRLELITDKMIDEQLKTLEDEDHYYRHIVSEGTDGSFESVEKVFEKKDSRAFRDDVQSLRDLVQVSRNIYDIPTPEEEERRQIAVERLKFEQQKVKQDEADKEIVVRFAGVGEEIDESEAMQFAELEPEKKDENGVEIEDE